VLVRVLESISQASGLIVTLEAGHLCFVFITIASTIRGVTIRNIIRKERVWKTFRTGGWSELVEVWIVVRE
jgi:trehalose utilization protein